MAPTSQTLLARLQPDAQGHSVLLNHPSQSVTAIDGWKSALFGTPFLVAGIFIGRVATNGSTVGKHAPDWLIGAVGAMFFFAGLFLFIHGVHGMVRKAAYEREASQRPGEPWLYDFHWHREGMAFAAFDDMLKRLLAALIWTAFLIPFGWIGANEKGAWPFLAGAAILGLFGLIFWYRWAAMLLDLFRYGNSFLTYESFPYSLGDTLRARLRSPHHVSTIDELTLTLRCVQEKYVTTGTGQNRSTNVVCYELYSDVITYDHERLTGFASGDIPIEFRVPSDQPATTLVATPPTYWEIEAKGKARGADYEAIFLVPVYKTS
jgi:hypothetical protein